MINLLRIRQKLTSISRIFQIQSKRYLKRLQQQQHEMARQFLWINKNHNNMHLIFDNCYLRIIKLAQLIHHSYKDLKVVLKINWLHILKVAIIWLHIPRGWLRIKRKSSKTQTILQRYKVF